jgi:uncharacterized protein YunC (DUF1805 family)
MSGSPVFLADAEFSSVQAFHIDLKAPLLVLKAPGGVLACGYLSLATMNRLGEVGALVTGVRSYDDMMNAQVVAVSDEAAKLGVSIDLTGRQALRLFCGVTG